MTMRRSWALASLVAACTLALAACSKTTDSSPASSGTGLVPGVTGSTGRNASGSSPSTQVGAGLHGGLGSGSATAMGSAPAASVAGGSSNGTPGSAVGTRP